MADDQKIEVGDTVYVGEGGIIHWSVIELTTGTTGIPWAILKSGMSGQRRPVQMARLRLHSKGTAP